MNGQLGGGIKYKAQDIHPRTGRTFHREGEGQLFAENKEYAFQHGCTVLEIHFENLPEPTDNIAENVRRLEQHDRFFAGAKSLIETAMNMFEYNSCSYSSKGVSGFHGIGVIIGDEISPRDEKKLLEKIKSDLQERLGLETRIEKYNAMQSITSQGSGVQR